MFPAATALLELPAFEVLGESGFTLISVPAIQPQCHKYLPPMANILAPYCTRGKCNLDKSFIISGAASGDRTHDILSHSQAFCR